MKKVLLFILVGILALSFAGCNKKNVNNNGDKNIKETVDGRIDRMKELGLEYVYLNIWIQNQNNIDVIGLGSGKATEKNPIYGAIENNFLPIESFELIKEQGKK